MEREIIENVMSRGIGVRVRAPFTAPKEVWRDGFGGHSRGHIVASYLKCSYAYYLPGRRGSAMRRGTRANGYKGTYYLAGYRCQGHLGGYAGIRYPHQWWASAVIANKTDKSFSRRRPAVSTPLRGFGNDRSESFVGRVGAIVIARAMNELAR